MTKIKDLIQGTDIRGDYALFIEEKHFINNGWDVDQEIKTKFKDLYFFRVIRNGVQQSGHGWIENGEIVQWG